MWSIFWGSGVNGVPLYTVFIHEYCSFFTPFGVSFYVGPLESILGDLLIISLII